MLLGVSKWPVMLCLGISSRREQYGQDGQVSLCCSATITAYIGSRLGWPMLEDVAHNRYPADCGFCLRKPNSGQRPARMSVGW